MLQIISGKFFNSEERNTSNEKAIYYSNFAWIGAIKTCVGDLDGVDRYSLVNSYVFNFVNQLEKAPQKAGVVVLADDEEIRVQFRLLAMFGFKSFFAKNEQDIIYQCRREQITKGDVYVPAAFVSGYCSKQVLGSPKTVDDFEKFVKKVIGLPRAKYKAVIRCLETIENSLVVLNYNIDLAYTLLVFALESLSIGHSGFTATWDDYHEDVKRKLETVEVELSIEKIQEIRKVLLESAHVKSQFQFVEFILSHVTDDYFIQEITDIQRPIRKSELRKALSEAYKFRSEFAHVLKPILDQLKVPVIARADAFVWENSPYLSYRGMFRLANHVIEQFIARGEHLEKEQYDWYSDLPGMFKMRLAPEYWIGNHAGFTSQRCGEYLTGFFQEFQSALIGDKNGLTSLDELFKVFEQQFGQVDEDNRRRMLVEYVLYNRVIKTELKRPEWEKVAEKHVALFDKCSIETIAYYVITKQKFPWNIADIVSVFESYLKSRYRVSSVNLPQILEIRIFLEIGNVYLREGSKEAFTEWLKRALLDSAGIPRVQNFIKEHLADQKEIDQNRLWDGEFLKGNEK